MKFVQDRVEGLDRLTDCINRYPPKYAARITGIPEDDIAEAARVFARADAAFIVYGQGITQYINAAYSVLAIANLALLTGNVGRPGAGVYPLVRDNNGQGACDMGVLPDMLPGYCRTSDAAAAARFEAEWKTPLPLAEGLTGLELISNALSGGVRAMVNVGANPVALFPDTATMKRAIQALDFFVALDIFMTPTAELAHVVLPVACFAEKDGTYTSNDRRIQRIRKAVDPPGLSRPEWSILIDLINRMGGRETAADPADVMDEVARTSPLFAGVSYERLDREVLHWPCTGPDDPGARNLYEHSFPAGKARFTKVEYLVPDDEPNIDYPFHLITRSCLYHFGSGARTRHSEQLSGFSPECFLEIHPEDAADLAIEDGGQVRVTSKTGTLTLAARITGGLPRKSVFVPISLAAHEVNALFSTELDVLTRVPNSKMCVVKIERV